MWPKWRVFRRVCFSRVESDIQDGEKKEQCNLGRAMPIYPNPTFLSFFLFLFLMIFIFLFIYKSQHFHAGVVACKTNTVKNWRSGFESYCYTRMCSGNEKNSIFIR